MYDVFSPALVHLGQADCVSSDTHSILWQEPGGLTLLATATANNLALLRNDNLISAPGGGAEAIYLIVNVTFSEEENEVTVNGKTADFLLHQRAAGDMVLTNTRAGAALAAMVTEQRRGLPVAAEVAAGADDPEIVRYPLDGGRLDDMAKNVMQYCGIGRRVALEGGQIRITFAHGEDISGRPDIPVVGSQSGRGRSPSLATDSSDFANVGVGKLTFQSGAAEDLTVGETQAAREQRREFYVGEFLQSSGESEADFRQRAEEAAGAILAEHILRTTVSADIYPADYGRTYRVGDIVRAQVGGTVLTKRITGATWLIDSINDKCTLQLGDQINTVVAEILEKKPTASSGGLGGVRDAVKDQAQKVKGIEQDYKSLFAKVTDLVAGMDAYVLNKVFEDYKLAVARVFSALQEQDQQLIAELAVKVSTDDLKEELANYVLAERLKDYLTVTAAAELYVTDNDVTAAIGAYIVEDAEGHRKSLAGILADVIRLQGDTEILGNLSIEDGKLKVSKGIRSTGAVFASKFYSDDAEMTFPGGKHLTISSDFSVSSEGITFHQGTYAPKPITSTDNTEYKVLGA